jgi:uncharacterized membrane protein YraQ (UPF0718 family)
MDTKKELKIFALLSLCFAGLYWLPVGQVRFDNAVTEALELSKWYAREHVVLCLLPAFWIAGAIGAFVSKASVMKYLGPKAPKPIAYAVGSVSGCILAVCSCTVLPLFAGIYRMGAGLGPASAFLYSGPAINALAIIMTAKILGIHLGIARAVGAVAFSVIIGVAMAVLFRKEEVAQVRKAAEMPVEEQVRPLWQTAVFFALQVGILVFANWGKGSETTGLFATVYAAKWWITSGLAAMLAVVLWRWFRLTGWKLLTVSAVTAVAGLVLPHGAIWAFITAVLGLAWMTAGRDDEAGEWFAQSWGFAKQIMPLLLGGVLVAGLLLGRPGHEGLIPSEWIVQLVGGNSIGANLFASVAGALMYFATLTEVPILQGLIGGGMGSGPALTLLLAGPALSLPSMIVLSSILGWRKTMAYVGLVVGMSALTGWLYGFFF